MLLPLHPDERPQTRCLTGGASTLSLRECLALIIGAGPRDIGCLAVASRLLARFGQLEAPEEEEAFFRSMESSGTAALSRTGLSSTAQARLLAAFDLARRYTAFRARNEEPILHPGARRSPALRALEGIPRHWRADPFEWLGFTPFYRNGRLGAFCVVEKGARTHVNVDPVELFAPLLALRPHGFFLFHNHPSGDTTPSSSDIDLTRRVNSVSRDLGLQLLGHGIVSIHSENWITTRPRD